MNGTSTIRRPSRRSRVKREMELLIKRIRTIRREAPDDAFAEQVDIAVAETTSKLLRVGRPRTAQAFQTGGDARTWDPDRHLYQGPQGAD